MTTPPVPQWAVDAAKDVLFPHGAILGEASEMLVMASARIIAAHAPQDGARDVLTLCNELRAACNNMTPADREKYHDIGMRIIYGDATAIDAARKKDL